ncbi:MAG: SUF system NifU family Fe-S cluster assembly protein [Candidatus Melainabacteria bacterium]|nr:SUF system NifU family Fe-S cluster assembly protein [Candidatus Melainabacteria bacterium]
MSLADDLYRETILDHYHHPRNQGVIDDPTVQLEGVNPLCGDEITLYLVINNGTISDVRLKSKGCSINMASGSMMTEAISGQPLQRATEIVELIKDMLLGKSQEVSLPAELEDLEALKGVRKYPVRIKCALLPWNTLAEAINDVLEPAKS